MNKLFTLIALVFTFSVNGQTINNFKYENEKISFNLPENWKISHSIFYDNKNKKVGEIVVGLTEFLEGEKFIKTFEKGFVDDKPTTIFIKGDTISLKDIRWFYALRKGEWEDGKGNAGFWYSHNLMKHCNSKSFQFVLYNNTGEFEPWMKKIINEFECK